MATREPLEVLVMQLSHPWWPVVESALRALGALAHNQVSARHRHSLSCCVRSLNTQSVALKRIPLGIYTFPVEARDGPSSS